MVDELTDNQVEELKSATNFVIGHEFNEKEVAIKCEDAIKVLEATGRKYNNHDESRIRAILQENCKMDEDECITFHDLKKLAYLMDNPLVKLGWKPVKQEPQEGSDVPNKLCQYLAENPRLSFFVTPELHFNDQYGNELNIERWLAKRKCLDGTFQHTYIEFDSRMKDFVHAQSNRWF